MTDIHNCHERIFTIQPYMMIHFHKLFKLNFFINAIFCGTQVFFCQTLGCMVASTAMYCHYFTSTSSSSLKHPFQELVVSDAMYTIVGHHILSVPLFSSKLFCCMIQDLIISQMPQYRGAKTVQNQQAKHSIDCQNLKFNEFHLTEKWQGNVKTTTNQYRHLTQAEAKRFISSAFRQVRIRAPSSSDRRCIFPAALK